MDIPKLDNTINILRSSWKEGHYLYWVCLYANYSIKIVSKNTGNSRKSRKAQGDKENVICYNIENKRKMMQIEED